MEEVCANTNSSFSHTIRKVPSEELALSEDANQPPMNYRAD